MKLPPIGLCIWLAVIAAVVVAGLVAADQRDLVTLTVAWEPPSDSFRVAGYKLKWGWSDKNRSWTRRVGPAVTHAKIKVRRGHDYYVYVTAFNSAGESGVERVLLVKVPMRPKAPSGLKVRLLTNPSLEKTNKLTAPNPNAA